MTTSTLLGSLIKGAALLCVIGPASALPPVQDPRLLPLVPPGAEIVAGFTVGLPVSHLVVTRNNTTDLQDLESFSGVDPSWLAMLDPAPGQADFVDGRVIMGIHFGKQIEIEFDSRRKPDLSSALCM